MKKFFSLLVCLLMTVSAAVAATDKLQGRVVDGAGKAVGYATVVVMQGDDVVAGITTDDAGVFSLKVADGEYSLEVEFVGYENVKQSVTVKGTTDLGDIVLKEECYTLQTRSAEN